MLRPVIMTRGVKLATALIVSFVLLGTVPARAATLTFVSGTIVSIGTDANCITQQGEIREQGYAGFTLRNGNIPGVNERWYAHVVISHPGNPCSGGSYTGIYIVPPPNTAFAIDAANPVFCAIRDSAGHVTVYYRQDQGCPQAPGAFDITYGYPFWAYSNGQPQAWPIAAYTFLELIIPLASSAPLTAQTLKFSVSPDVAVWGYPQDNAIYVTNDVVARHDFDNDTFLPDVCNIQGTLSCAVAP